MLADYQGHSLAPLGGPPGQGLSGLPMVDKALALH